MFYLKIDDNLYEANFEGLMTDHKWDDRESKTINFLYPEVTYEQANEILRDNVKWFIREVVIQKKQETDEDGEPVYNENYAMDDEGNLIKDEDGNLIKIQEPVMVDEEIITDYDNSDFCLRGDIVVHSNGTVSVKMGKLTDLEQAYELLYGGM